MNAKEIPGTLGFTISEDGVVYNPEGIERSTYVNGDGYITVSVKILNGKWRTFGVHRLLALAHIECPGNPVEYEVNHIDTVIENNTKGNLEWVKSVDNNSHAAIYRGGNKRPLILAYDPDARPRFFRNVQHAAEVLGRVHEEIWEAIKTNQKIDGWTLTHHRFDDPIPSELYKARRPKRDESGRRIMAAIKIKDMETGIISSYESLYAAANAYSTTASHIYQCMVRHGAPLKLFRKRYMVVREEEEFPEPDVVELENARTRGSREVVAFNKSEKKLSFHSSGADFYRAYGLSKKAVTTALRIGRLRNVDGWVFIYHTPENLKKLTEFIGSPVP
jgi:hypothetical protein